MANNEAKTLKTNTLEEWRQNTNDTSHRLGDVELLDGRLTDKVYSFNNNSNFLYSVYQVDDVGKALRFETKPEEVIDAPATIVMTGSPTIPSSFVEGVVLFQGSSGSESFTGTINYINVNKISLRNTTGTFNASLPIKFSTDSIANTKLVRIISESYELGYVKVTNNGGIRTQTLTQLGFHVPNITLAVTLTGSPSIPASFTEGAVLTQSGGFSGTLHAVAHGRLYFKSFTGSFSTTQNVGIPHTDAANRIVSGNISTTAVPTNTYGNFIELHNIPNSDHIIITSTNAVDAITELQDDIGEIASLGTTNKTDVVSSINELETAVRGTLGNYTIGTNANDLVSAINEIETVLRGTNSNYTTTVSAGNFRDALNEHESDIGNMTFTGLAATDISAAIRELRTELGNHASLGTNATQSAVLMN